MSERIERARQQRAGLRAAVGLVESSLSSAARGRAKAWSTELRDELANLGVALEQHIEITEAPDGLLADIASAVPRLAHRVDRTRQDHGTLRKALAAAVDALPEGDDDEDAVPESRNRVVELLTAIVHHRHLGADLVYEAYNVDIEAAD